MTRFPRTGRPTSREEGRPARRRCGVLGAGTVLSLVATLAACSSGSGTDTGAAPAPAASATADKTPVTITLWSGFTDRELGVMGAAVKQFETSHPWITVKNVGAQDDDKIVKAIRGRQRARRRPLVHRGQDRFVLRQQGLDRPRPVHRARQGRPVGRPQGLAGPTPSSTASAARCRRWPTSTGSTTTPPCSRRPATPSRRRRPTELLDMAVKLTTYNPDGSIKVAGFVPLWGFYEMAPAHVAPLWGAAWANADGKSNFAADPALDGDARVAEEVRRRDRLRQAAPVHLGRG